VVSKAELSRFSYKLAEKHHLESLWMSKKGSNVTIGLISVRRDRRGMGHGQAAMEELVAYADKHKLTLYLKPSSEYGSSLFRLVVWYSSLGFKLHAPDGMVRYPR